MNRRVSIRYRKLLFSIARLTRDIVGDFMPSESRRTGFVPGVLHDRAYTRDCDHPQHETPVDVVLRRLVSGHYRENLLKGQLRNQSLYWLGLSGTAERDIVAILEAIHDGHSIQLLVAEDRTLSGLSNPCRAIREFSAILNLYPKHVDHPVCRLRNTLTAVLARHRKSPSHIERLDIRSTFSFVPPPEFYRSRVVVERYAAGWLGWPQIVANHRGSGDHTALEVRVGDHIGHLIGVQFGAPDDSRNVSSQNGAQNGIIPKVGWGTYFALEKRMRSLLNRGAAIYLQVWTYRRRHTNARYTHYRDVIVDIFHPSGERERIDNLSFGNFPMQ